MNDAGWTPDVRGWVLARSSRGVAVEMALFHDEIDALPPLVEARAENARLREALRDASWLAKLARGSSWPGEMAQRVELAADRVAAAVASLSETGEEPA